MTRFRGLICVCALALGVAAASATGASAATFYVNMRNGDDTAPCTSPGGSKLSELPCATINGAIKRAEAVVGPNTIELSAEENPFKETIKLTSIKDAGLTINGEEPGVVIVGKEDPALITQLKGAVTVSNLRLRAPNGPAFLKSAVLDKETPLTLDNVAVENESGEGEDGIDVKELGTLTMNGGSVEMEGGSIGYAIYAREAPLALNGVNILTGAQAQDNAGGILSEKSTLSVTNTHVSLESGLEESTNDIVTANDSSVVLQNDTARQNDPAVGVLLENSPASVNGLSVEMVSPSSKAPAVVSENEGSSTFSHLETSGASTWTGAGLLAIGGDLTLTDSHLVGGNSTKSNALRYDGFSSTMGLLVQRSVLQAAPNAEPGAILAERANATMDSSEILGGKNAIYFSTPIAATYALTISASTLDAGAPGIVADAAGTNGIEAVAKGGPSAVANVTVQGSIVLEKQVASTAAGDQATVNCTYSAVPSEVQTAGGGAGAIACANGSGGNTEVNPLSSLFPEPLSGYQLSPSSGAVDSVPASVISLPFGLTPSATDLAGNPRVMDGNGDCVAVQDRGSLELQGHAAPCPIPSPPAPVPVPVPVPPSVSALTISPSSFHALGSGKTLLPLSPHNRKRGTKIGWRDSQAATTTFTILRPVAGRTQGKSCRKPGKANKHGKRCTLFAAVGSFTHTDAVGANSVRFSGRLKNKRLPRGTYRLQAVPRDAAGTGAAVFKGFKIK